jgi:hypothetical protein
MLFFDGVLGYKQSFQFIDEVALNYNLLACIFPGEILNSGAAGEFDLKLMSESMNLLDKFFGLYIGG